MAGQPAVAHTGEKEVENLLVNEVGQTVVLNLPEDQPDDQQVKIAPVSL